MLHKADHSILVKYENDPLCGYTKDSFKTLLREKLSGRVSEAWLFGSFTGETFHRDSDIDMILICETDLPFPERNRIFDDIYDLGPVVDILIYTEEEFSKIRKNPSSGFWKAVTSGMIRLI